MAVLFYILCPMSEAHFGPCDNHRPISIILGPICGHVYRPTLKHTTLFDRILITANLPFSLWVYTILNCLRKMKRQLFVKNEFILVHKFAYILSKSFQLQGASPPDPHPGFAPGPHWGFCPQTPV